ncbi:MAG: HNH endonuclease signature motif containing protein [Candidatus Scalindua sp.]
MINHDLKKFSYKHKYVSREFREEWLITLAKRVYKKVPKDVLEKKRKQFNKKLKYQTVVHYSKIVAICGLCQDVYAEQRHHIIQLQNGGYNGCKNLIALCDDCHRIIHPWMEEDMRFADIH